MGKAFLRRFRPLILAGTAVAMAVAGWYGRPDAGPVHPARPVNAQQAFAKLPLAFEPNQGQSDPAVRFQSRTAGYSLYLTAGEAVLNMRGADTPLHLAWQHANPDPAVAGLEPLPGKHNYLKGRDPAQWHRNIPTYGKVRYRDLYPGVDLVYYGRDRKLEYDLVVAPGADPAPIELALAGMDSLRIDDAGAVQVHIGRQTLSLSRPVIYQDTGHGRQQVDGGYVRLADDRLGLRLGAYDRSRPLIIDPVLTFSTYLGGTGAELARGVAVDGGGNVYLVGETNSQDISFNNVTAKQSTDTDVLLAQLDSSGTLQGVVYIGGSGADRGFAVAVDSSGVYVSGDTTSSKDFPIKNASQPTFSGGGQDAFVVKLSNNLSNPQISFATYLGGGNEDEGRGIAVDNAVPSNIYVTGATRSSDFPISPAVGAGGRAFNDGSPVECQDPINPNNFIPCLDAFVVKYSDSGAVQYAVYLGGRADDAANAIAVSAAGEAYLTGVTASTSGITGISTASFEQTYNGGQGDAFIIKLKQDGTADYGTYFGGGNFDQGQGIALDASGNVFVTGITNSGAPTALPLVNPAQANYAGGGMDGFFLKLNPLDPPSSQLKYSSYLGGSLQSQTVFHSGQDQALGIAVNSAGEAVVVGETMSADFLQQSPIQQSPLQSVWFGGGKNGWGDAFVTKVDTNGKLLWSTYLGGSDDDWASGVAVSGTSIYVAGSSFSRDFPLSANAQQTSNKGAGDAFLFRLDDTADTADLQTSVSGTPDLAGSGETITYTAKVSNLSSGAANGVLLRATLPAGVSYQSASPANCTVSGQQLDCPLGTIAAGGSAIATIKAVNNTAGDITFTASVVRAFQPDPTPGDNTASVTTKAAVGSSSGGGSSAPLDAAALLAYAFVRRRRQRRSCPA